MSLKYFYQSNNYLFVTSVFAVSYMEVTVFALYMKCNLNLLL